MVSGIRDDDRPLGYVIYFLPETDEIFFPSEQGVLYYEGLSGLALASAFIGHLEKTNHIDQESKMNVKQTTYVGELVVLITLSRDLGSTGGGRGETPSLP